MLVFLLNTHRHTHLTCSGLKVMLGLFVTGIKSEVKYGGQNSILALLNRKLKAAPDSWPPSGDKLTCVAVPLLTRGQIFLLLWRAKAITFLCFLNTITSSLVTLHKRHLCKQDWAAGDFSFFHSGENQLYPLSFMCFLQWRRLSSSPGVSELRIWAQSSTQHGLRPHSCTQRCLQQASHSPSSFNTNKIFYISSAGSSNLADCCVFPWTLQNPWSLHVRASSPHFSLFFFFNIPLQLSVHCLCLTLRW